MPAEPLKSTSSARDDWLVARRRFLDRSSHDGGYRDATLGFGLMLFFLALVILVLSF